MARGDGVDRTCARNQAVADSDIGRIQGHNEREKEVYSNPDIVLERTCLNIHFKEPTGSYTEMFEQMCADKTISTRGLKADAIHYNELVLDVNSAYFHNHGGYDYAKDFYTVAYQAAVKIVGGEQYILSAVMHADERNKAMSEALKEDVYHYHLHVVYIPVVEKQIKWSKRCKDKALRDTVKETIMQVSMSKKWDSTPALGEDGNPIKSSTGKTVLRKSYSVLQDDYYNHMHDAGYTDIERGERGSDEEHLSVTQFKAMKEEEHLAATQFKAMEEEEHLAELSEKSKQKEQEISALDSRIAQIQQQQIELEKIEQIEAKPKMLSSKVTLERDEYETLITAAKKYIAQVWEESSLREMLHKANEKIEALTQELRKYKSLDNQIGKADDQSEIQRLKKKLSDYDKVIERYRLWHYFESVRGKNKEIGDR